MFSAAVRAEQARRGSRERYARLATAGHFASALSADVSAFIAERDSAYLATAGADGQPYVQHRGGPAGFLRVLDERTVAFADYAGNRQYISIGNLAENERAFLFLMDYAARRRLKLWGCARVVAADPDLFARLATPGYRARIEQAIVFTVSALDWNCSQHIPRLLHGDQTEP
jgi:predicted pyridoxine 5'-phosphate oxidase superfamily flavin-nucleotide-binding protein